ncbi:MAG: histone deacetylase family protein [Alphaproteobacteria bacterium]
MIRFRRLFDTATEVDRRHLEGVQRIFRRAFPYDPAYAEKIAKLLASRADLDFDPVILVAEDARQQILGFSLIFFFPDLRFGYLDYIASDPDRRARGIGDSLYEASRELLMNKDARGLFLDVPPDDPALLKDKERLLINRQRLKFYERYGARPVVGTKYETTVTPANEGYFTFLVFDALERTAPLRRTELRKAMARILGAKAGMASDDPTVREIVLSVRDDPVRLRAPRYATPEAISPGRQKGARLKPLTVVIGERHEIHHLRERGYVERPVRMSAVLRGLSDMPVEFAKPRRFGESVIRAVHDPGLISYLANACSRLKPDALIYPTVFPIRRPDRRPKEFEMRAGYFCVDTFTPLTSKAYIAARAAVDCAMTGADLLLGGSRLVYALMRPPGHHAERAAFGGFCYFNNGAVAAHHLSHKGRVAFIDVDYHHGNGSQDIFYRRSDVSFTSIHGHPNYSYPYFSGFADERGEGDGLGFNRNYPLRPGVNDTAYLDTLDDALGHVRRFKPDWLVVSLGFDIMRGDPTGSFLVSTQGMRRIGERLGGIGVPTLIVQEGGYSLWNLRRGANAFFHGLASTWY